MAFTSALNIVGKAQIVRVNAAVDTGNIALDNVLVSDPLTGLSAIVCPGGNGTFSLAPGATVQCTATYAITQADIGNGFVNNLADADGECKVDGCPVNDDDPHSEPIPQEEDTFPVPVNSEWALLLMLIGILGLAWLRAARPDRR